MKAAERLRLGGRSLARLPFQTGEKSTARSLASAAAAARTGAAAGNDADWGNYRTVIVIL